MPLQSTKKNHFKNAEKLSYFLEFWGFSSLEFFPRWSKTNLHRRPRFVWGISCVFLIFGSGHQLNSLRFNFRLIGQRYYYRHRQPIPCEQLVSTLCDIKQAYTQYGGKRPFGVSLLYMGWDSHLGFQLYQSDPSGMNPGFFDEFLVASKGKYLSLVRGIFLPCSKAKKLRI